METIKIRAWDGNNKVMIHVIDAIFNEEGEITRITSGYNKKLGYFNYLKIEDIKKDTFKKIIPLLYTGFKDKNNKEIYKKHIIESEKCLAEVVWISGCWELIIYPKDGSQTHGGRLSTYIENYSFEIVGNKFENKDLLNRKNE